jgi:flagellar hook-length control protein FliK
VSAVLMPVTTGLPPPATAPPATASPGAGTDGFAAVIASALAGKSPPGLATAAVSGEGAPPAVMPPALMVLLATATGQGEPQPEMAEETVTLDPASEEHATLLAGLIPPGLTLLEQAGRAIKQQAQGEHELLPDRIAGAEVTTSQDVGSTADPPETVMAQTLLSHARGLGARSNETSSNLDALDAAVRARGLDVAIASPGSNQRSDRATEVLNLLRARLAGLPQQGTQQATQPVTQTPSTPVEVDLDVDEGDTLLQQLLGATEDATEPVTEGLDGDAAGDTASDDLIGRPPIVTTEGDGADAPDEIDPALAAISGVMASTATGSPARVEVVQASVRPDGAAFASMLAETVQSAVIRGTSEVRLVLNPPDLGQLDINIVETDQGLRIRVEASQASARELIERHLPALQQALESRELRVDRLQVTSAPPAQADGSMDQRSAFGQSQSGGQGDGAGSGQAEWSPLAALGLVDGDGSDNSAGNGAGTPAGTRNAGSHDGSLDVLA